jgi:quercetin dioxygenase-like cupin family protein
MISSESEWTTGRVGMLYRDLTPHSLNSRVVVSQIRLPFDGEVPDYVHYHKVDFQMIYCVKGRIKVVYEDQGEPFWLETGDCVLQPPEIRHRVLECTAGAEVIEVSMPAEHETWVEHDITLPTNTLNPAREFSGQRFVRHIAAENAAQDRRDLGISAATGDRYSAYIQKINTEEDLPANYANERELGLFFRLNHTEMLSVELEYLR